MFRLSAVKGSQDRNKNRKQKVKNCDLFFIIAVKSNFQKS